jgi:hypothetical protein
VTDSVSDYVFLGFFGIVLGALAIVAAPVLLPFYLVGRFVVAPLLDRIPSEEGGAREEGPYP